MGGIVRVLPAHKGYIYIIISGLAHHRLLILLQNYNYFFLPPNFLIVFKLNNVYLQIAMH